VTSPVTGRLREVAVIFQQGLSQPLPPCLGAQHPAGRDPALFDHLPYDGRSIGFDLSVPDHSVSQVKSSADDAGRGAGRAPEPPAATSPNPQ
jgi:hypothetical protein